MCRWLRKCFAFTQINEDFLLVSAHLTPFSLECYIPLRLYRPVCYDMEGNDLETGKERESRRGEGGCCRRGNENCWNIQVTFSSFPSYNPLTHSELNTAHWFTWENTWPKRLNYFKYARAALSLNSFSGIYSTTTSSYAQHTLHNFYFRENWKLTAICHLVQWNPLETLQLRQVLFLSTPKNFTFTSSSLCSCVCTTCSS